MLTLRTNLKWQSSRWISWLLPTSCFARYFSLLLIAALAFARWNFSSNPLVVAGYSGSWHQPMHGLASGLMLRSQSRALDGTFANGEADWQFDTIACI